MNWNMSFFMQSEIQESNVYISYMYMMMLVLGGGAYI